ncbi:MAG: type II secretion system secretin GspD [Candidatus Competibacterales bacterium]
MIHLFWCAVFRRWDIASALRCRRCRPLVVGLGLGLLAAVAVAAPVTLNLKDADINAFIASVAEITGRNFIVDPRVQGRVSVISSRAMEEDEVYQMFLAVLAVYGYAAVPGDNAVKIIPAANAKQEAVPSLGGGEVPADQVVTQVITLDNVAATQLVPVLRPLVPPTGHLAAYGPSNALIIADAAANVDRIVRIVQRVDRGSDAQVEVVRLNNASAREVVALLTNLEQGRAAARASEGSSPLSLVADERTNSVLMSGDPSTRLRLRTLIAHLDTPLERSGNTQVVYLRYARAEDLVPILQGVSGRLVDPNAAANGVASGGDVTIQADEATNALVITAPVNAFRSLRQVIAQLDIRRAQVLVEAVVAEVTSDRVAELGIQWLIDGSDGGNAIGYTSFPAAELSLGSLAGAFLEGGALPLPQSGLQLGLGSVGGSTRFGALISALASDADTNILSTPTLVTLDNEEAEIVVGQNVPFVTGTFTTEAGNAIENPFQTIERQDVGLTLRVRPQINEGSAVQLEISQEVSSVVPTATALAQGPTTNKRSIRTNVLVEDGQILVLGGLIDSDLQQVEQKVPGLGDVPVVGALFRYRRTSNQKRHLLVFIHPLILRDQDEAALRTNDKYSYIRQRQFEAAARGTGLLPQVDAPVLPPPEIVEREGTVVPQGPVEPPSQAESSAPPDRSMGFGNR